MLEKDILNTRQTNSCDLQVASPIVEELLHELQGEEKPMNRSVIALVLGFAAVVLPVAEASAANPCIACQNRCLYRIRVCEKTHPSQYCFDKYGEAYGACKVKCKGSPVCLNIKG